MVLIVLLKVTVFDYIDNLSQITVPLNYVSGDSLLIAGVYQTILDLYLDTLIN